MYNQISLGNPFYQGDILADTPFFTISENKKDLNQAISIKNLTIIILSQTCDIGHRDFIIIAPVLSIKDLQQTGLVNNDQITALKNQKVKYWFYLPADNIFTESYVEFTKIIHIPKLLLDKNKRIKSLSDLGRHWLAYKIADFFGRPIDRAGTL